MNKQKFTDDVKKRLWEMRINQARLAEMSGLSKATISRALYPHTGIDARTFLTICKNLELLPDNYYE